MGRFSERDLERFKQVNAAGEDGYHAGQGSSPSTDDIILVKFQTHD